MRLRRVQKLLRSVQEVQGCYAAFKVQGSMLLRSVQDSKRSPRALHAAKQLYPQLCCLTRRRLYTRRRRFTRTAGALHAL